jgi:uncharacterized protein (DUF3084 family)
MRAAALTALVLATAAACGRDEPAATGDTVGVTAVDGSIPLVSPGSVPLQREPTILEGPPLFGGVDTTAPAAVPVAGADTPLREPNPVAAPDTVNPDSIIGRDSAITGPFHSYPPPPADTGNSS